MRIVSLLQVIHGHNDNHYKAYHSSPKPHFHFSPEILQRQPFDPIISDIWSLGVCYYIALNDSLPFKLGDDRLMLQKQLTRDWRWRPRVETNLSKEVKDMVTKMLEPDTSARVTTEALINHKWVTTGRTAIE